MRHFADLIHDLRLDVVGQLLNIGVAPVLLVEFEELAGIVDYIQYDLKEPSFLNLHHYYDGGWVGFLQDVNSHAEALFY